MWGVSDRYLESVAKPHTQLAYVEILQGGQVVATIDGTSITDPDSGAVVSTLGGSIQVDRTSVRRSGTINFLDVSGQLFPDEVGDLFAYMDTEIRPWIGLKYWDVNQQVGQPEYEYVPLATLVVTKVEGTYPQLSISGYDRMWFLDRFPIATKVLTGTPYNTALLRFINSGVPVGHVSVNIPDTDLLLPHTQLYAEQDSVQDAAHNLALAAGWQLYVDPMGTFVGQAESSTDDDPVMIYAPGEASTMMRPTRSLDAGSYINAVVFTCESAMSPSAPFRGYAQDDNPESLTYAARVGVRVAFESSPLMTSNTQCVLAARTSLRRQLGIPDILTVPVIPNYALESGDVIRVTDPDQGIDWNLIADSFPLGMRASDGAQVITCRARVAR